MEEFDSLFLVPSAVLGVQMFLMNNLLFFKGESDLSKGCWFCNFWCNSVLYRLCVHII